MKKKRMGILLAASILILLAAGCGRSRDIKEKEEKSETGIQVIEAQPAEETKEHGTEPAALNIGVLTCVTGACDRDWNQQIIDGVNAFAAESPGSMVQVLEEESGKAGAAVQLAANQVSAFDVLVCCGSAFEGIGQIALDNPDTLFLLMDAWPVDMDKNIMEAENIYACRYREEQQGFLAGAAAAMETSTGKVAAVSGVGNEANVNIQYGFACGVLYVNEKEGKNVQVLELPSYAGVDENGANVGGNYIGSLSDVATARVIANALMDEGADVLFAAAGSSGQGVFSAAAQAEGVRVIGLDIDRALQGKTDTENVTLTSIVKATDREVLRQLKKAADGTFAGANVLLGAESGEECLSFVQEGEGCSLNGETLSLMETLLEALGTGEVVPASFGEFIPR